MRRGDVVGGWLSWTEYGGRKQNSKGYGDNRHKPEEKLKEVVRKKPVHYLPSIAARVRGPK